VTGREKRGKKGGRFNILGDGERPVAIMGNTEKDTDARGTTSEGGKSEA